MADLATQWRTAFESRDLDRLGPLLADDVRWGDEEDTPQTCHSRSEVLATLARQAASGATATIVDAVAGPAAFFVEMEVTYPEAPAHQRQRSVYQVLTVRDGLIASIRGYPSRSEAATAANVPGDQHPVEPLAARAVIPILNVSNLPDSFAWFQRLGWTRQWAWGERDGPPAFGAIESDGLEIWLSQGAQGAPGMWLAVWVDNVDTVHAACVRHGLEVIREPQNESWGVREMHVRHPDGHVLRLSQPIHHH